MIDVEKLIEDIEKMSVLELNTLVKALEEKFGVSAAAPVAVAGAATAEAAPAVEEKTEFDVVLKEYDPAGKIKVIKLVKDTLGLGLAEAKALVDKAPSTLKEAMPKEAAEQLAAKLKEVGAVAELK